jgi:hypothetical protein
VVKTGALPLIDLKHNLVSTGLDYLDSELGGLRCNQIYLVKGEERLIDNFIYAAIVRNTSEAGRAAVFVDCKNAFNPYEISRICRRTGLDEGKVLENTLISRPFTAYQLNSLLESGVPEVIEERPALLIFSGLLELFSSEDVEERDAEVIMRRVLKDMRRITRPNFPLLLTHTSSKKKNLHGVTEIADAIYTMKSLAQGLKLCIERDWAIQPRSIEFLFHTAKQLVLDNYMEVS